LFFRKTTDLMAADDTFAEARTDFANCQNKINFATKAEATSTTAGLMSAADKERFDSMTRIIIASDSFKGTFTSGEVADGVEKGIRSVCPHCQVVKLDVADGGEGTMAAVCAVRNFRNVTIPVSDPLGRKVSASYAVLEDGTAVIEMSQASGLTLLAESECNPLNTSTYGTGELIAHALSCGCRKFLVGIGGSATNDAGMGMLSALGYRFLDDGGNVLPATGRSLAAVSEIDRSAVEPALKESEFVVACDVDSPLCGPQGAACVFGPQKGADAEAVRVLDEGLSHFASVAGDSGQFPGAGSAGGLGYAFKVFLNAYMVRGIDLILDAVGFDDIISGADLVITGEGRYDGQTSFGKVVHGVCRRASARNVPVLVVAGSVDPSCMAPDIIRAAPADGEFADLSDISAAVARALLSFA